MSVLQRSMETTAAQDVENSWGPKSPAGTNKTGGGRAVPGGGEDERDPVSLARRIGTLPTLRDEARPNAVGQAPNPPTGRGGARSPVITAILGGAIDLTWDGTGRGRQRKQTAKPVPTKTAMPNTRQARVGADNRSGLYGLAIQVPPVGPYMRMEAAKRTVPAQCATESRRGGVGSDAENRRGPRARPRELFTRESPTDRAWQA